MPVYSYSMDVHTYIGSRSGESPTSRHTAVFDQRSHRTRCLRGGYGNHHIALHRGAIVFEMTNYNKDNEGPSSRSVPSLQWPSLRWGNEVRMYTLCFEKAKPRVSFETRGWAPTRLSDLPILSLPVTPEIGIFMVGDVTPLV